MPFDHFAILLNALLVIRVLIKTTRARRIGVTAEANKLLAVTAGFAVIYLVAYAVLLSGIVDRLEWSKVMVGVSVPVWWIIWPALADAATSLREQQDHAAACLAAPLAAAAASTAELVAVAESHRSAA